MLNQGGVKVESGTTTKSILVDVKNVFATSCMLANTGVSADANGKKIIKAGTPVTGSLVARGTAFTLAATANNASNAIGVVGHDVDVTNGTANGAVILFGFIDYGKLESSVQALITTEVKAALNMIKFVS